MNVQKIARRLLRATGWDFEGPVPAVPKCVAIAVPHTSNWDGVLMLALAASAGIDMAFMIKDDWLRGPMGPLSGGSAPSASTARAPTTWCRR